MKLLSKCTVAFLCLIIFGCVSASAIGTIQHFDSAGNAVTALPTGEITSSVSLDADDGEAVIISALYNSLHQLVALGFNQTTTSGQAIKLCVSITVPEQHTGYYLETMAWDDITSGIPIVDSTLIK